MFSINLLFFTTYVKISWYRVVTILNIAIDKETKEIGDVMPIGDVPLPLLVFHV